MSLTPPIPRIDTPNASTVERLYAALADIGDLIAAMPQPQALYAGVVHILERHVGALLVLAGEIDYEGKRISIRIWCPLR
jgi:hypothetical protein